MMRAVKNSIYVAWRYLCFHKVRMIILIVALSIIMFVPLFLEMVVEESQEKLNSRADSTPLILGAKGSSLDLAVNTLYFILKRPEDINMLDAKAIDASDLAFSIPIYTRFRSGKHPIVGTTIDYFDFRELSLASGRQMGLLGEAVIGSNVAKNKNLKPGDSIISSPENLFDLAGQYPLKMNIVGVLDVQGTADDDAILVDVRTSWVMAGLGHGHENLLKTKDATNLLKRDEKVAVGSPKVRMYNVISQENIDSFHFHGSQEGFPITSAIVVPLNHKSEALLLGRYQSDGGDLKLISPDKVITELIESIFRIKKVLDSIVITVGLSTILAIALIFILSYRLREKEINTIFRLGCSRAAIGGFITAEILIITFSSIVVTLILLVAAGHYSDAFITHLFI